MKYLGIDFGTKRIGLALSDERGVFAFARETIPNDGSAVDRIADLARKEEVGQVVMGDTKSLSGLENDITEAAERFAARLEKHMHISIVRVREAFSSMEAARFAPKGEHNDAAAAAIILQRHLDAERNQGYSSDDV